jgi:hypothetical protein
MRKVLGVLCLSVAAISGSSARSTTERASASTSEVIPVEQLHFYQDKQGLTVANGWGDPAKGPHSNFIKMPGNARSRLHTHRFSYYGVVISGVLANEPSDGATMRPLRPGSYWFQTGKEPHVTNCLSATECLIFVTSKGAFDFHLVSKPTAQLPAKP